MKIGDIIQANEKFREWLKLKEKMNGSWETARTYSYGVVNYSFSY